MQSIAPAPGPQSMQSQDMSADNDLRAQLAAVINNPPSSGPHGYNEAVVSSSASPRDHNHNHNIDPAIGGGPSASLTMMSSTGGSGGAGDSGDDNLGDGRKGGKRELSQSKRAAQNRAAQRAFRQRKEGYIKKLEEQVRELHALEENYKAIQSENYSLREYIIHLQSRLIESQGEYPQPPPNVNLNHPHPHPHPRHDQHMDHMQQRHDSSSIAPMAPMSQMQASAARGLAAASLGSSGKHEDQHRYKDSGDDAADEEIIRSQLGGTDGLPTSMAM